MAAKEQIPSSLDNPMEEDDLSRRDLEELPSEKLVDIIAWQRQGNEMLAEKLDKAEAESVESKVRANWLPLDPKTGILTCGALASLGDILINGPVLALLRSLGYGLSFCFLDIDYLRKHNLMGGRTGGDAVLQEVAKRLKILYRRKSDVIAFSEIDSISDLLTKPDLSRIPERGDKMIAWRFASPAKSDLQRRQQSLEQEVSRIKNGFEGAVVSYPLSPELNKQDIKKLDPKGTFKVKSGIVTAPVSVTFVYTCSPMPTSRSEGSRMIRRAVAVLRQSKQSRPSRVPGTSEGVSLKLCEDDLI